jgi:hypothetical protein
LLPVYLFEVSLVVVVAGVVVAGAGVLSDFDSFDSFDSEDDEEESLFAAPSPPGFGAGFVPEPFA